MKTAEDVPQYMKRHLSAQPHATFLSSEDGKVLWANQHSTLSRGDQIPGGRLSGPGAEAFEVEGEVYNRVEIRPGIYVSGKIGPNMKSVHSLYQFIESIVDNTDHPYVICNTDNSEVLFANKAAKELLGISSFEEVKMREFMDVCPVHQSEGYQNVGWEDQEKTWRRYRSTVDSGWLTIEFPTTEAEEANRFDQFMEHLSGRLHNTAGKHLKSAVEDIEVLESNLNGASESVTSNLDRLRGHVAQAQQSVTKEVKRGRPPLDKPLTAHLDRILNEAFQTRNLSPQPIQGEENFDINDQKRRRLVVRIVEEFVSNASQHNSKDADVNLQIQIEKKNGTGVISLSEDGQGFDPKSASVKDGSGLALIEQWAIKADVAAELTGEPGEGSWLDIRVSDLGREKIPSSLDLPVPAVLYDEGLKEANEEARKLGAGDSLAGLFRKELPPHVKEVATGTGKTTAAQTKSGLMEFTAEPTGRGRRIILRDCQRQSGFLRSVLPVVTIVSENQVVVDMNQAAEDFFGRAAGGHPRLGEIAPRISPADAREDGVIDSEPPVSIAQSSPRGVKYQHLTFHIDIT